MASKRRDLCPNTQEELLAERNADGTARSKREECPYCIFLIGAHNKVPAAPASSPSLEHGSLHAVNPAAEMKQDGPDEDEDECCICLEPLWREDGKGTKPGGLAELACRHPMHSECLGKHTRREVEAAKASGIPDDGMDEFGPRGSCPVCRQPISLWVQLPFRWMSKDYWTREIRRVLFELGPQDRGERQVGREWRQVFQQLVNERCANVSAADLTKATEVMIKACKAEGRVAQHIHGVDDEGHPTLIIRDSDGLWDYHEVAQRLWLLQWGPVGRIQLARRGRGTAGVTAAAGRRRQK